MGRCWLVYAIAPEGVSARAANDALNEYISDAGRGIPVVHDHFTGKPHGGFAVLFPRDDAEVARLDDPGRSRAGRSAVTRSSSLSRRSASTPSSASRSRSTEARASTRCAQPSPPIRATGGSAGPPGK
jgi:hypothetical protein